uniref:Uncharacterized protein n=1 Tax=Romanomermis culicivorax TaxID=13658 RepID=A0A915HV74_ROMCU
MAKRRAVSQIFTSTTFVDFFLKIIYTNFEKLKSLRKITSKKPSHRTEKDLSIDTQKVHFTTKYGFGEMRPKTGGKGRPPRRGND